MNNDTQFEDSFSELAYSTLQNSYPELLSKVVGFQVIDSNDDKSKALAIFGLKLGSKYFYIPVFFLSGRVKPLELIYNKDEDQFIPLERDWISLISKSQEMDIGQAIPRPSVGLSNPNLERYATPPRTGRTVTASATDSSSILDSLLSPGKETSIDIVGILATADPIVKKSYLKLLDSVENLDTYFEVNDWGLLKEAISRTSWSSFPEEVTFQYIEDITDPHLEGDRELSSRLLKQGFVLLDKRAGMAVDSYFTDSVEKFESITDNGIYKIMDSMGEVKNYLAFVSERDYASGSGQKFKGNPVSVLDLGSGHLYTTYSTGKRILGIRSLDHKGALDGILSAMPSIESVTVDDRYMLIKPKGDSFVTAGPFNILRITEIDGLQHIEVVDYFSGSTTKIVVVPGHGCLGRPKEGTLAVTSDVKVIPVSKISSVENKFHSQNPKMLEVQARDKGFSRVELFTDQVDWTIRAFGNQVSGLSKKAAAEKLCLNLGLRGIDSETLIKEAQESGKATCFIKQAVDPYASQEQYYSGPQYAPMPVAEYTDPQMSAGYNWPEHYYQEQYIPYPATGPRDGYRLEIGPQNLAQQPQQAGYSTMQAAVSTGDKNVMDAGTIASLSKICEIDDLVDTYLPDLTTAMDRVGRMIFMYWYRADKFSDKYTDTEIKETEDMLRNLFKELGKVIYKFKTSKSDTARLINYE